jgi:predicted TIM-barrel fold metal-dependent hydrolase
MRIDGHVHWDPEEGYLERLVEEERRLGFDKVCLNGAVWLDWEDGNAAVLRAAEKHPDMIVPFAFFPLGEPALAGRAGPDTVRALRQRGFRGLKFIRPPSRYDDQEFYPIYGAAEEAGLVCLFHTGIVARTPEDKQRDVNNERHRPIYLDTIARAFPDLKVVGAHLGNPWYEEAAMACRWNPNLYFDLSGSSLKAKPPQFFGGLLWWTETSQYRDPLGRHAWAKILFGSDVAVNLIEDVMKDFQRTMDALKLRPDLQHLVFGGTMAKLLGLE